MILTSFLRQRFFDGLLVTVSGGLFSLLGPGCSLTPEKHMTNERKLSIMHFNRGNCRSNLPISMTSPESESLLCIFFVDGVGAMPAVAPTVKVKLISTTINLYLLPIVFHYISISSEPDSRQRKANPKAAVLAATRQWACFRFYLHQPFS